MIRTLPPPPEAQPSAFSRVLALPRQLLNRWRARPVREDGEAPARDESAAESAAIGGFLGGLEISPVKGTRLVEIIYSSPDPEYAAKAANAVAREYVQQNLDLKLENTNSTLDWLKEELDKLRKKVEASERAMANYDTVKIPDDLTRRLRLPLPGLVPAVAGGKMPVLFNPVRHDFGEAFRSLRTSLVFTNGTDGKRMIAVTSSQPLEGKTTTACNLAVALALGGSRVMLIDADMRRPGLHRTLGLQNEVGLSHVLTGQARVREAVQRTSEPNLYVMTAGRTPPNPSELLSSARMQNLIANLKAGPFDWVTT